MKTAANNNLIAETPERPCAAAQPAAAGPTDTRGETRSSRCDATVARRRRGRRPRALSSPVRSVYGSGRAAARPRSPSVRAPRSPPLPPPPLPPPLSPPPAYPGDVVVVAGGGEGARGFAYFSPRPPPAPLWLAAWPAPCAAPRSAPYAAPCPTLDTTLISHKRQKLNLERFEGSESAGAETHAVQLRTAGAPPKRCPADDPPTRPVSPPASPRSVAVQTLRKTISNDERDGSSLAYSDKTNEWAGGARALRDGHVRLALRALRQLRRAERLHRALLRAPADTLRQ